MFFLGKLSPSIVNVTNIYLVSQIGGYELDLPQFSRVMKQFGGLQKVGGCSCVDSYRRCFLELLSNSLNEVGTFRINLFRKRLGGLGVSVLESRLRGLDSRPCLVIVLCL